MDVYCPLCDEPFDVDTFVEYAAEADVRVSFVSEQFFSVGCGKAFPAWGPGTCVPTESRSLRQELTAVLVDALGDDLDGIASELDDFQAVGLLDDPA